MINQIGSGGAGFQGSGNGGLTDVTIALASPVEIQAGGGFCSNSFNGGNGGNSFIMAPGEIGSFKTPISCGGGAKGGTGYGGNDGQNALSTGFGMVNGGNGGDAQITSSNGLGGMGTNQSISPGQGNGAGGGGGGVLPSVLSVTNPTVGLNYGSGGGGTAASGGFTSGANGANGTVLIYRMAS
jgi:hypothetical protein